jgi:hypothetical protein
MDIAIDTIVNAGKIPLADYLETRYSYLDIDDKLEIMNLIEEMMLQEGDEYV